MSLLLDGASAKTGGTDGGLSKEDRYFRDEKPFMDVCHPDAARQRLAALGFGQLPEVRLEPENPAAAPLAVCTGVDIGAFDARKHHDTATKAYYAPTGRTHLLNQSASAAMQLLDRGRRVLLHASPKKAQLLNELRTHHPRAAEIGVFSAELHEFEFVRTLYERISAAARQQPVSRVDLVIYDSFMPSLSPERQERPFAPVYEERIDDIQRLVSRRVAFLHYVGLICYDLLLNRGQTEMRLVLITSLASRRPGGNLYVDALHKGVSTVFLETLAREARLQGVCDRFYAIEPAPGVVDRGPYDTLSTRQATMERALVNGFPYRGFGDREIERFPQMNPLALGELCALYLTASEGDDLNDLASPDLLELVTAGRDPRELAELLAGAVRAVPNSERLQRLGYPVRYEIDREHVPAYILNSNVLCGLPSLTPGYVLIPLAPRGQYF